MKVSESIQNSIAPVLMELPQLVNSTCTVNIRDFNFQIHLHENPDLLATEIASIFADIIQKYITYMEEPPYPKETKVWVIENSVQAIPTLDDDLEVNLTMALGGCVELWEDYYGNEDDIIQMIETAFGYEGWFKWFVKERVKDLMKEQGIHKHKEEESLLSRLRIENDADFTLSFAPIAVAGNESVVGSDVGYDLFENPNPPADVTTTGTQTDTTGENENPPADVTTTGTQTDTTGENENAVPPGQDSTINDTHLYSPLIGVSATLIVAAALFSYAYRRHTATKGYALSEDYENDLESQSSESRDHAVNVIKSLGLSDIAASTPAHSGNAYLGVAAKAWSATRRTMSDLAAGATQEEFVKHGMNIQVYGSHEKQKREITLLRGIRPSGKKKGSPKGSDMESFLDPIVEVDSLNSSRTGETESWQNGIKEINNAPNILPALSVSSSPSDETPLTDYRNIEEHHISSSLPSEDFDILLNTPLVSRPEGSSGMDGMTPYADMTGISGSPDISKKNDSNEELTPLYMRCLTFDDNKDKSVSDFSSQSSSDDKSSGGSYVKDMLDIMDPNNSESSSDGCVKDMLSAINHCAPDGSSTSKESNELEDRQEDASMVDARSADSKMTETFPIGESSLQDIGLDDFDLFCPPEIKATDGKVVMNDPVSGTSTGIADDNKKLIGQETNTSVICETGTAISSFDLSDNESIASLITVENK